MIQHFFDIFQLLDEVPPVLLSSQELNLRYPARNVGVEIEILLHGRHEDQLADKTVVWRCGCEVCLEHLNNIYIRTKQGNLNN